MTVCQLWALVGFAAGLLVAGAVAVHSRFERRRLINESERMAFHDALTELPNRLLFLDRAGVAFSQARRAGSSVAVVFLDLDRFKLVNDSLGHAAGDAMLRNVAERLREHLRGGDTVSRFGGDEFTVLLPSLAHPDDVVKIASKILEVLRQPVAIGDRQIVITASIGISMFPADGNDPETLLRNADAAMYRAKERGGNAFQMYTRALNEHALKKLELESRLRRAVAGEEFVLYYQPRLDMETKRVVAFEALLRWNDPERGLIMPRDFIAAAETSGLILPIGEWVFRAACAQGKLWQEQGCGVVISVNLSPRQFHRHDLAVTIKAALRSAGLEPKYLELEVEEATVMASAEGSLRILTDLKALGVRVMITGFGAGYSSISYLRRFPIDGLKLDRSFSDSDKRSLATAALGMARALNLKVVGENVETQETADFFRSQFCDDIQGFLVSAALPPQECGSFMRFSVN